MYTKQRPLRCATPSQNAGRLLLSKPDAEAATAASALPAELEPDEADDGKCDAGSGMRR